MGFAKDDDPIQALLLNRPHEALRIRIAGRRLERRLRDECGRRRSAAAIAPQWAARNVRHDIGRSGTGPIPSLRRIVANVKRATRCPRFLSAPWIRRSPTWDSPAPSGPTGRISRRTSGRPTRRRLLVHFRAIRCRCHLKMVSGVTSVATARQAVSSEAVTVHGESTPLAIGQPQAPPVQVLLENAVLFPQILNDLKLMAIHPARKGRDQDPQRGRRRTWTESNSIGPRLACLSLRPSFQIVGNDICVRKCKDRTQSRRRQIQPGMPLDAWRTR